MPEPLPLTETRNPRSLSIDSASTEEMLAVLNAEDRLVAEAVRKEIPRIAKALDAVVERWDRGGRLFYAGAGTSGRLGVLDAAECPPTFGTPPERVQALIAGGTDALLRAVEGAEDSREAGRQDLAGGLARRFERRKPVPGRGSYRLQQQHRHSPAAQRRRWGLVAD